MTHELTLLTGIALTFIPIAILVGVLVGRRVEATARARIHSAAHVAHGTGTYTDPSTGERSPKFVPLACPDCVHERGVLRANLFLLRREEVQRIHDTLPLSDLRERLGDALDSWPEVTRA